MYWVVYRMLQKWGLKHYECSLSQYIIIPKTGIRIFYVCLQQAELVLLHAYKKQSNKAPPCEIALAEKRLQEVLQNERDYLR